RGARIATIFQDPMTSLNPLVTIGRQITEVIVKHQGVSSSEAKSLAIDYMERVGIPEAKKRFNEYPFQYSGGMRQRI
ncbi:ATP-binding cassette domain-containing protein, partial [Streptococcus pyogenes]